MGNTFSNQTVANLLKEGEVISYFLVPTVCTLVWLTTLLNPLCWPPNVKLQLHLCGVWSATGFLGFMRGMLGGSGDLGGRQGGVCVYFARF